MSDPFDENAPHVNDPTSFPADRDLELIFIGKILFDQSMAGLEHIQSSHLYFSDLSELLTRMRALWDKSLPLDPVLITDRDPDLYRVLMEAQDLSAAGIGTPAIYYAGKVLDLAKKRAMLPLLSKAAEMSMNGVAYEDVLSYIQTELDSDERRIEHDTWQARHASDLIEPPEPREWLVE